MIMYIFKNAFTSIKRNKGRNILIALIIIVISAACAVTLAIRESANYLAFFIIKLNVICIKI